MLILRSKKQFNDNEINYGRSTEAVANFSENNSSKELFVTTKWQTHYKLQDQH